MTFELTIHGESPAELLDALTQLGGTTNTTNIINSPTPAPQPQSEPTPQPDKPKAQTSAKAKKAAQKPAAAPEKQAAAEEQTNPTAAEASASPSQAESAPDSSTPSPVTEAKSDSAMEDKIRSLIMALMKQGRTKDCKAIITASGAKSISTIKPESYTVVWEQLCKLKEEVDADAAD